MTLNQEPDLYRYFDMLGRLNTAKSECSRETSRQRIFAAVKSLDGEFTGRPRHDETVTGVYVER